MSSTISLDTLIQMMNSQEVVRLYVKALAENDNSKNQIYLGSDFETINILPYKDIQIDRKVKKPNFKARLDFAWLDGNGQIWNAPYTQLILYPQYPEVRMSGFLKGCQNPPSHLMANRMTGRLLFLGITKRGKVLGHAVDSESYIANEFYDSQEKLPDRGVFFELPLGQNKDGDSRSRLLDELHRVHNLGWIDSKRLQSDGMIVECRGVNCGGYTLEAELGVSANGYSEPDFLGWEVKQHLVPNFERPEGGGPITLMTPEPTGGYYKEIGAEAFVRKYGYPDKRGRSDRMNFGGVHRFETPHSSTGLTLTLEGYDKFSGKIIDIDEGIYLRDSNGDYAAIWYYADLMTHWNRKHALAVYVPSLARKQPVQQYSFGYNVRLGLGTDFLQLLSAIANRKVYYDPGIKLENISSTRPKLKRRSQFRMKSSDIPTLYKTMEIVSVR